MNARSGSISPVASTPAAEHTPSSEVTAALRRACARIAPVWPLERFVAVNPYLGMIAEEFPQVAGRLRKVAGARMTLPASFYVREVEAGRITREDIEAALDDLGLSAEIDTLLADASSAPDAQPAAPAPTPTVPTVAAVWETTSGQRWTAIVTDRVSQWAASWFDEGQALWSPANAGQAIVPGALYAGWRDEALQDRTPEIHGAAGFRALIAALPPDPMSAACESLRALQIPAGALDLYLHRLLLHVGGWAAHVARIDWERRLQQNSNDPLLVEFLCVLLSWESALLRSFANQGLSEAWRGACRHFAAAAHSGVEPTVQRDLALHTAYERAVQRALLAAIETRPAAHTDAPASAPRPRAQAVFCIDVRSEIFRRHLEASDPGRIETLGFAGFFGFAVESVPLAHETGAAQCPVLLKPAHRVYEIIADGPDASHKVAQRRRIHREVGRAWNEFKMGAISCFGFVSPIGLAYLPKLFTDAFGLTRPVAHPSQQGLTAKEAARKTLTAAPASCSCTHGHSKSESTRSPDSGSGIPLATQVELAARALKGMSLTGGFARLVLLTGHGSTSVNNPHAAGLDCGACGGRSGEANARLAASVLNDPAVREGLAHQGIAIPADTVFLACLHDTTQDEVTVLNRAEVPHSHAADLAELEQLLASAGAAARAERAPRLQIASPHAAERDRRVFARSRDWAQVRPEWGLAGCAAFIAAPRSRTVASNLAGRAFLHSYDWRADEGFGVLELIMTAPMVVASWISLQYFASTVDNHLFGAGNKTLHNVVGTVGVFEGNSGDLRVGLPWQSVHDGEKLQHEPVRLNVIIEAPLDALQSVIDKHETVRHLVENGWLNLFAMNDEGRVAHRYAGRGNWQSFGCGEGATGADSSSRCGSTQQSDLLYSAV